MYGAFKVLGPDSLFEDYLCIINSDKIFVYNNKPEREIVYVIGGLQIGSVKKADDTSLYLILDTVNTYYVLTVETNHKEKFVKHYPSGAYLIDGKSLLKGKFQAYKILNTIGGNNLDIRYSNFSQRLSFICNSFNA